MVEIYGQQIKFDYETLENVMQARSHVANDSKTDDMARIGQAEGALRADKGRILF
ncbi:MAG: hypothetical protein ACJAS9_004030 [Polaribacter sp.]